VIHRLRPGGRAAARRTGRLLLGLQLAAALLAPLAHARADATGLPDTVHIEEPRDAPCAPGHDPAFCHLCRLVRVAPTASGATAALPLHPVVHTGAPPDAAATVPAPTRLPPSARGPPASIQRA
jgi:hypothetical protein